MAVKIGDKVQRRPVTLGEGALGKVQPVMTGTVVYIHPKGRYHTVEFRVCCGVIRESFKGVYA